MAKPFIFGYHRRLFRLHRTLSYCLAAIVGLRFVQNRGRKIVVFYSAPAFAEVYEAKG